MFWHGSLTDAEAALSSRYSPASNMASLPQFLPPKQQQQEKGVEQQQQSLLRQASTDSAVARVARGVRCHQRWAWLLLVTVSIVMFFAWPWVIPYMVWTNRRTHFALVPPGVDPHSYVVSETANLTYHIPKIIHQTWKTEHVPQIWQAAQASCKEQNPDWEYKLWTDASAREFIQQHYPNLLHTYDSYPYNIQRADAMRYAILDHYGGAYIDLDIVCRRPLDYLRSYEVVLPKTWPVGFSNDFMMSAPKHPFMQALVHSLTSYSHSLGSKYPTVMFSTGPMFVTLKATWYKAKRQLAILPDAVYGKYDKHAANPLFVHLHGSTWHGDDAKSILWVLKHPLILGACLVGLLALTVTGALSYYNAKSRQYVSVRAQSGSLDKMV